MFAPVQMDQYDRRKDGVPNIKRQELWALLWECFCCAGCHFSFGEFASHSIPFIWCSFHRRHSSANCVRYALVGHQWANILKKTENSAIFHVNLIVGFFRLGISWHRYAVTNAISPMCLSRYCSGSATSIQCWTHWFTLTSIETFGMHSRTHWNAFSSAAVTRRLRTARTMYSERDGSELMRMQLIFSRNSEIGARAVQTRGKLNLRENV